MSVRSAFGRPGPEVVAEPQDYAASQIANDTNAALGATLDAALDALQDELNDCIEPIDAIEPPGTAPLVAQLGRTLLPTYSIVYSDVDQQALKIGSANQNPNYETPSLELYVYGGELRIPHPYPQGNAWGVVYEMDFRLPGPRANLQPGAHVFTHPKYGDATWWLKGTAPHAYMASALEELKGLRLSTLAGGPYGIGSSLDMEGLAWWLPFSQFPNFRPECPFFVEVSLAVVGGGVTGRRNQVPLVGMGSWASNADPVREINRGQEVLVGVDSRSVYNSSYGGYVDQDFVWAKVGLTSAAEFVGSGKVTYVKGDEVYFPLAVMRIGRVTLWGYRAPVQWVDPDAGEHFMSRDFQDILWGVQDWDLPNVAEPGFCFALKTLDAAAHTVHLQEIRLMQFGMNA